MTQLHPHKKDRTSAKRKLFSRRLIATALAVVLIITLAGFAYRYFTGDERPGTDTAKDEFVQTQEEKQIDAVRNAITVEGDTEKSNQIFEEAVRETTSDPQKSELYAQRALALFYKEPATEENKRQALDDALTAYELLENGGNARLIEMIAADVGEVELAAQYRAIVEEEIAKNPTPEMQAEAERNGE